MEGTTRLLEILNEDWTSSLFDYSIKRSEEYAYFDENELIGADGVLSMLRGAKWSPVEDEVFQEEAIIAGRKVVSWFIPLADRDICRFAIYKFA